MKLPRRKKILAACLALIIILALCEGAGRLLQMRILKQYQELRERSAYRTDVILGYALKPGLDTIYGQKTPLETNSLGYRDGELEKIKPEGALRVVCIGDSRTFGLGLSAGETYPEELERLLRAAHPQKTVEVINAGVPGYTTREGVALIEEVLPPLQPDWIVASFGHNDRWRSPYREGEIAAILGHPPKAYRTGLTTFLQHLDDLLDRVPGYFALKVKLRGLSRTTLLRPQSIEEEFQMNLPPERYEENLRRMVRAAGERGIRLLLVHVTENPGLFTHTERGAELFRDGRIEEAEDELGKATAIPINFSPAPYYYLGLIHELRGEEKKAEEALRTAEFGSLIYPHPLGRVQEIFRRRGITRRALSTKELSRLEPIRNPHGLIETYADATRRAAREEGAPFITIGPEEARESHYIDANHPSTEGNAFLARKIFDIIEDGQEPD